MDDTVLPADNKGELNRDCKDLVEFKITHKDLLADSESISTNTLEEEEITTNTTVKNTGYKVL